MEKPYVAVVGAVNMDICGQPFAPLIARDSNPGTVRLSHGGVGRNIAHNLALLGTEVEFITALGEDLYGADIRAACTRAGIRLSGAVTVTGGKTSTYLYITDETGEMELAVADMDISRHLTPEFLASRSALLQGAAALVLDGNPEAESLRYLVGSVSAPIFADPVSVTKSEKLIPILPYLHAIKPNLLEAQHMTGCAAPEDAARAFLRAGVERVYISLGGDGLLAADSAGMSHLPCCRANLVSANGGGDAMMAALITADLQGYDTAACARFGLAAGAIAVETRETINPALSWNAIRLRLND